MAGLIAKIIFGGSMIGIGTILFRKIPILAEMPEEKIGELDWKKSFPRVFKWIKNLKIFPSNLSLQKILSKAKVLTSVVGKETGEKLQRLNEEHKKREKRESDNYWKELKKVKNQKDEDLPA